MIRVRSIGVGVALLIFVGAEEAQGESTVAQTIGFEVTDNWQLVEGAGTLALAPALSEGTSRCCSVGPTGEGSAAVPLRSTRWMRASVSTWR